MPGDVDKSLLDRLAALRGSPGAAPERAPPTISVDTIQRAKTPTREDALAARLKSLRQGSDSPSSTRATPGSTPPRVNLTQRKTPVKGKEEEFDDADAVFMTDDDVLEALLGDGEASSSSPTKQKQTSGGNGNDDNDDDNNDNVDDNENVDDDEKVKALLEELSKTIPKDSEENKDDDNDSDDSDGEKMTTEADAVIARLRDEMEVEASLSRKPEDKDEEEGQPTFSDSSLALPSVPQDLATATTTTSTSTPPSSNIDDITARLSALRASSEPPASDLPSVPTSLPVKDNPNRLKTTTKYTDEDMDSWCTVCSEDATLRCLGCVEDDKPEGDPYCARCWKEMHLGPTAAFDDRSHRAVLFSRKQGKEKRVALGAS